VFAGQRGLHAEGIGGDEGDFTDAELAGEDRRALSWISSRMGPRSGFEVG
jgi:hypothetical protein